MRAAIIAAALVLALCAVAVGAPRTTLSDVEDEVMCPTCGTALSVSEAPLADRQRALIQRLIDQGLSKEEVKRRLVDEFGPGVLGSPPREGFSMAAYVVPLAVLVLCGAGIVAWVRRRSRAAPAAADVGIGDLSFESQVDADLLHGSGDG